MPGRDKIMSAENKRDGNRYMTLLNTYCGFHGLTAIGLGQMIIQNS